MEEVFHRELCSDCGKKNCKGRTRGLLMESCSGYFKRGIDAEQKTFELFRR